MAADVMAASQGVVAGDAKSAATLCRRSLEIAVSYSSEVNTLFTDS